MFLIKIVLILLLISSTVEAKPCSKVDYIIGDSIAWMMQRNLNCKVKTFHLDAEGARTPSMILNAIVATKKKVPNRFDGSNVILSSGASNDPGRLLLTPTPTQLDKIEGQLRELHSAAHIFLLGVGPGHHNVYDVMRWNDILFNISKKYPNVIFMGPLKTWHKDPVHPKPRPAKDFQIIINSTNVYLDYT